MKLLRMPFQIFKHSTHIAAIAIFFSIVCFSQLLNGQSNTTNWIAFDSSDWFNNLNWDNSAPDGSQDAIIPTVFDETGMEFEANILISGANALAKSLTVESGFLTIHSELSISDDFTFNYGNAALDPGLGGKLIVGGDAIVGGMGTAEFTGATSASIVIENNSGSIPAIDIAGTLTIGKNNFDSMNGIMLGDPDAQGVVRAQKIIVGDNGGGTLATDIVITASDGEGLVIGNGFDGNGIVDLGSRSLEATTSDIVIGKNGGTAILSIGSGSIQARDIVFGESMSSTASISGSGNINARNLDMSTGGMLELFDGQVNLTGDLTLGSMATITANMGTLDIGGSLTLLDGNMGITVNESLSATKIQVSGISELSGDGVVVANTIQVGESGAFAEFRFDGNSLGTEDDRVANINVTNEGRMYVESFTGRTPKVFSENITVGDSMGTFSELFAGEGANIDVSNTTLIQNQAHVSLSGINTKLVTKDLTIDNGFLSLSGGAVIEVTGTLNVMGGEISTEFDSSINQLNVETLAFNATPQEVLEMSGVITSNIEQTGGTLAPGSSPGLLVLDADYSIDGGILEMELGGLQQATGINDDSRYDHIDLTGDFTIGPLSTLQIVSFNNFEPTAGNSFDLWDVDGITSGSFDTLVLPELETGLSWNTSLLYTSGIVSITAVPEPSSCILLGLFATAALRRRQRTDS